MTTSHRGPAGSKFDHTKHFYKPFNPMLEPGLISILFLSCGKYDLAKTTLDYVTQATSSYIGEIEWVFLEQGGDEDILAMFRDFDCERKIVIQPNHNYSINNGFNSLFGCSRGEYCLLLEDDWIDGNPTFNFLQHSKDILDENPQIGIVGLRDIYDPWENYGFGKLDYLPYSCEDGNVEERFTESGHKFLICNDLYYAWNNNPNLVRKQIYLDCGPYPEPPFGACGKHGESEFQERTIEHGVMGSHIGVSVFYHIGGGRRHEFERR